MRAAPVFLNQESVVAPFPYRLIFMRHGETAYNAEGRLQGQLDIPLNARGREQARSVGRTLQARIGAEIEQLEAARRLHRFAIRAGAGDDGDRPRRDWPHARPLPP